MQRFISGSVVLAFSLALLGWPALSLSAQDATPPPLPEGIEFLASTTLYDTEGQPLGLAAFTEGPDGRVSVAVLVEGLSAGEDQEHGVHVHETGICDPATDPPFASAGGHFNPLGTTHGGPDDPEAHAGDLGNIRADESGKAQLLLTTDRFTLSPGPTSLADEDGSALVIHADRDDLETDPAGESGPRILCGVIYPPMADTAVRQ